MNRRELFDSFQSLKLRSIDERNQAIFPVGIAMDGAKNCFHFFFEHRKKKSRNGLRKKNQSADADNVERLRSGGSHSDRV